MFENFNDGYHANRLHQFVQDFCPSAMTRVSRSSGTTDSNVIFRTAGYTHIDGGFNATHRAIMPIFPKLTDEERIRSIDGAPRVVGFDDRGREVLTYVEGEAGSLHLPPALLHEHGIWGLGRFIRGFHDAVAAFVPAQDAVYRIGARALGSGEIVCHGDLGYQNTIGAATTLSR